MNTIAQRDDIHGLIYCIFVKINCDFEWGRIEKIFCTKLYHTFSYPESTFTQTVLFPFKSLFGTLTTEEI